MVTHEEKVALGVLAIGAAALIAYLMLRPVATVQAGSSLVPVGIASGADNPATITVPPADTGTISFPGITIPGLTNTLPNLTAVNVTSGAPQCGCTAIGLNQQFYGSPADQAAAMAPTILSMFSPSGGVSGSVGSANESSADAAPAGLAAQTNPLSAAWSWLTSYTPGTTVPLPTPAPASTVSGVSVPTEGTIPYV